MKKDSHIDDFLKAHYKNDKTLKECMAELGLNKNQVVGRAHRLGLTGGPKQARAMVRPDAATVKTSAAKSLKAASPSPKLHKLRPPDDPAFVPPKPVVKTRRQKAVADLATLGRNSALSRNVPVTLPRVRFLERRLEGLDI